LILLYSKTTDNLPITTVKLEQDYPCLDPAQINKPTGQKFYGAELENNLEKCSTVESNKFYTDTIDSRFSPIDFTVDELTLYHFNGVKDILQGNRSYDKIISFESKSLQNYSPWQRPTIGWKLECETANTSRLRALEAISNVRSVGVPVMINYMVIQGALITFAAFVVVCIGCGEISYALSKGIPEANFMCAGAFGFFSLVMSCVSLAVYWINTSDMKPHVEDMEEY
jgi:hypothetical protein